MFNIGDLIVGKPMNPYGVTDETCLCKVIGTSPSTITVVSVGTVAEHDLGVEFKVYPEHFITTTYENFKEKFPSNHYDMEAINKKEEIKMPNTLMNKENIYVLTDEERETLREEIIELLEEYDYSPTEDAVNKILDEWAKNKGWMIELFKKHPNYNGKFQIVFDADYNRVINSELLGVFANLIKSYSYDLREEIVLNGHSYYETLCAHNELNGILDRLNWFTSRNHTVTLDGMSIKELKKEYERWHRKLNIYYDADGTTIKIDSNQSAYTKESYDLYKNAYQLGNIVQRYKEHLVDKELATEINAMFPKAKAAEGQKMSRLINKICTMIGMDKLSNYNREFAKYSDAINPLAIKRHTILSCHPVDYLTMSFGNSWASCHTIDKQNKRHMPNDYSGCYSSGTESYMLDGSSFVFYTVDKNYNGNEYELQDKINRNMFHIGEDKLIQARVYPQATDGETGIYKQIREIAQKVIADCLEMPNMWKNYKGTDECRSVIDTKGTHYTDYTNFPDCNVSYLKRDVEELNKIKITVGHKPICPCCGVEHTVREQIECDDCYNEDVECACCGWTGSRDDMHEIDGRWYCDDCCFYCDYHEEYEAEDYTYIEDYGRVCDYALENGDFFRCEHCDEWHYGSAEVVTEDDTTFCSYDCAVFGGYTSTYDGYWYPEDEVYYCEHCDTYVHADDWNDELECCTDCEDEVREENESEEE